MIAFRWLKTQTRTTRNGLVCVVVYSTVLQMRTKLKSNRCGRVVSTRTWTAWETVPTTIIENGVEIT